MADEPQTAAPAPVATSAPAPAPAASPVVARPAANKEKPPATSSLITNPAPVADPDAKPVEEPPKELPESTLAEMEAGRRALQRNAPPSQKSPEKAG